MEEKKKIVYRVFDLEGNYVCEGTKYQVQKQLGLPRSMNINDYSKLGWTLAQKYKVIQAGNWLGIKPYELEILKNQILMLKREGNTTPMKDIDKNIKWLEERGVKAETKKSGKSLILVLKKDE